MPAPVPLMTTSPAGPTGPPAPTGDLAQQLAALFQQVLDSNPALAKSLAAALAAQEPSAPSGPPMSEAADKAEDAADAG
jgi:hypothetical protein